MLSEKNSFKKNVCIVEIESDSFCNRKCSYCINSLFDKTRENIVMPPILFEKIIRELAEVEYDRMVTFHRYNEPFHDQNNEILNRISFARKKLPNAILAVSSNADYIDENYLSLIRNSGLNELYLQCHIEDQEKLSIEDKKEWLQKINKKIGNFPGRYIYKENAIVFYTINSGFSKLTIQLKNFRAVGVDRGGLIKALQRTKISQPCYQPLTSMTIDFNGMVTMCCNTVSYIREHQDFIIGDCNINKLSEIYGSEKAVTLRKNLIQGNRMTICEYCNISNRKLVEKYKLL